MEELISVIVPVYNVEDYLQRCIDSILCQTYKKLEIILVDDGSTDNSGKICDDNAKIDSRILVIHKVNGGLSDARNAGIKNSNGKYISFIDSDDYIREDYIQYLYSNLKENDADVSIGDIQLVFPNSKIENKKEKNSLVVLNKIDLLKNMLYGGAYYISACSKLYKKSLFDDILFPFGKIHEDVWTLYKIYDNCEKIVCGSAKIYNYIIRDNSITNSSFSNKDNDLITATDAMCDYLKKYNELDLAIDRRRVYSRISLLCKKDVPKDVISTNVEFIRNNKCKLLKSDASIRDKIATILISVNINFFYGVWGIYCKLTNRIR